MQSRMQSKRRAILSAILGLTMTLVFLFAANTLLTFADDSATESTVLTCGEYQALVNGGGYRLPAGYTVYIAKGETLTVPVGVFTYCYGTIYNDGKIYVSLPPGEGWGGEFYIYGGELINNGEFINDGWFDNRSPGKITNNGKFVNGFALNLPSFFNNSSIIDNYGMLINNGRANNYAMSDEIGIINNYGIFSTEGPADGQWFLNESIINNYGTMNGFFLDGEGAGVINQYSKYTVTFDSNGGSSVSPQTVGEGHLAVRPADPTKDGACFAGWYLGNALFNFGTPITGDITLVAHWEYTVTFDNNGGSLVAPQLVKEGELSVRPIDPTKDNADFEGWYLNDYLFDFNTPITSNITLVAKWKDKTPVQFCLVTFDSKGGSAVEPNPQWVIWGWVAEKPTDPKLSGYSFAGWYLDDELFDFDTPVMTHMTLVAHWLSLPPSPSMTVNGVDIGIEIVNGIPTLDLNKLSNENFEKLFAKDAEFDFSGYEFIDIKVSAGFFKNIDSNIVIKSTGGTVTIKAKTLWNNSGKDRLIQVRNEGVKFGNI